MQNAGVMDLLLRRWRDVTEQVFVPLGCSELGAPSLRRFVRNRRGETHETDHAGQSLKETRQEVQTAAKRQAGNEPEHLAAACLWMWRKTKAGAKTLDTWCSLETSSVV